MVYYGILWYIMGILWVYYGILQLPFPKEGKDRPISGFHGNLGVVVGSTSCQSLLPEISRGVANIDSATDGKAWSET